MKKIFFLSILLITYPELSMTMFDNDDDTSSLFDFSSLLREQPMVGKMLFLINVLWPLLVLMFLAEGQ